MQSFFTIIVCLVLSAMVYATSTAYDNIRKDEENEKTTTLQKVIKRARIVLPVIAVVAITIVVLYCNEKAKTTMVSEKAFSVIDTNLQTENRTIGLTIQDENNITTEVIYGLPDYPNYIPRIFNIQSPIIDELEPDGNSDALILQEFADGTRKVILRGSEDGELSNILKSYTLKMEAE